MANEAYEVMKTLVGKKVERDEYQIYGEHVACKIRKLTTDYAKSTVQHIINNILYEAELGKYNYPVHHYEYSMDISREQRLQNQQTTPSTHTPSSASSNVEESTENIMDNLLSL